MAEGGVSTSESLEPAVVSKGLKLMMRQKIVHLFSYSLFPGMQHATPVDWMLLETEDIEGESIRCHPLQGNEVLTELFERYRSSDCKAVVLINTSNDYQLAPDLVAGVGKPCLPVIVLKRIDGEIVLRCLEDASEVSIDVYAKIDMETDIDGGRTGLTVQKTWQHHSSPQTTPQKQPLPESSLSTFQKVKAKMYFQSKPVSDLKEMIKLLMFTSDMTPMVVVEDQGRFSMIMAAMHNYEAVAKRDSNHSDLNDVIKKLRTHMDALFSVDLPFYIFLIYRMHKKYNYYVCEEMRAMIVAVIDRVESEDKRAVVVQAMTTFIARGDFEIMYNADKTEDRQVPLFHQLEQACIDLADTSFKLQIPSIENVGDLPNGMKPVYKNFVYSRMLWISLAMMLRERRSVQPTRKVLEVWATKFVSYHQRVELTSETIRELEAGLEVGQLLKLPSIYSLSVPQLTDFIASINDRTLRPFVQIMECFRRLKRFLVVPTEVVFMLSNLRSVYMEYLTPPVVSFKMKSISCEGTLGGCISEGIKFLDMVLEWLGELEVDKEVKDSELESWLKLLLRLVDITGDNPTQYLRHFMRGREKVVKTYRTLAVNCIVTATQKCFGKLSIQQFCMLYKAFKIYSKNVVEEFLRSYSIPATVTLSDPTWKEFFGAVVVRSQSAQYHQFLAEFMMACSVKYKESGRAVAFITDLLKLDVEKLLSVREKEDKESHNVRARFSLFLKDFIHRNALTYDLLDPITSFLMSMTNKQNEFQRLVLDVLRREVVPDLRTLQQGKGQQNNFKNLMKEVVRILKNDLSWLSSMSPKQHFCWGILGTCVAKIAINKDTFDWVHDYSDVISGFELSVVYSCYCIDKKLSVEERVIVKGLPEAVEMHPSEDLHKYFEWIGAVQGVLQHWKEKFQHHDVTYDEVISYTCSHVKVLSLGESVSTPNLVVGCALIGNAKATFLENFELLNVHLLKYIPSQSDGKWCMLPPLLETYGVVLPQATQDFIVKKVAFPKETLIPQDQLGTPLHPSTSGLFKPGVEISLCLHKTVTLRELGKVLRELEAFQQPLLDHLEMLVFFKLHKSSLFDKYLRFFLKESAEDISLDIVTLDLSLASKNVKIQARDNLAKSLVRTNALINQIMLGTVTYSQILPEGESVLKELDITEEFDILRKYGQYNLTGVTYDGLDGVKEMLEYVKYTTNINNIRSVCSIILKNCSDNPNLRELYASMDDDVWEEDHSQLTPLEAKEKMKLVKETKLVKEYLHSENCPEIFAALADVVGKKSFILSRVTEMDKLVSIIQGKDSYIQQCLADKQAEVDKLTRCIHEKDVHIQQCLSGVQIEIDTLSRQIQEKNAYIQQCLADKQAEVDELTRSIHENDVHIQQCLSGKQIEIDTLSRQIQEKDAYMQNFIAEKETEIKQLSSSMDMYIQQIIKDKKVEVENLSSILTIKEDEIEKLGRTVHDKDSHLQQCLTTIAAKETETEQFSKALQERSDRIDELSKKVKQYEGLHDDSWLEVDNSSDVSWRIERHIVQSSPQTRLGEGSWGYINSGHFRGQHVAFKYVHEQLFLQYPGIVKLIKREIGIMARIQHPNLVRFIGAVLDEDVEEKGDVPIIVLELMDMNLRVAYSKNTISQSTALSIFCDIAYALHYLHEQLSPIIHRDVSAPNVLLKRLPNQSFKAKISDFGSANVVKQSKTAGAGALIYSAPEMFPPEDITVQPPQQTVKVDVFSYGIVLLEVVGEEMPTVEKRASMLQTCEQKWKGIFDLIICCTKRSPKDRPIMREILNSLHRISINI